VYVPYAQMDCLASNESEGDASPGYNLASFPAHQIIVLGNTGYRRGYEDIGAMVAANEPLPFGGQPMKGRESVLLKSDGGFGDGLPLWVCSTPSAQPTVVIMYYVCYSILVGMVVMSLFVGVITIGMFSECT